MNDSEWAAQSNSIELGKALTSMSQRIHDLENWVVRHPYSAAENNADVERLKKACREIYNFLEEHQQDDPYDLFCPIRKALEPIKALFEEKA